MSGGARHKSYQEASIDHVKRAIGKREWLQSIHDLEIGVGHVERPRLGLRVGDHLAIDVNTHHIDLREGSGDVERPPGPQAISRSCCLSARS